MKLILAAILLFSANTFASNNDFDECFDKLRVNGFTVKDRNTIVVKTFFKNYEVRTFMCNDLRSAEQIFFDTRTRRVCKGDKLTYADAFGSERTCIIQRIREDLF